MSKIILTTIENIPGYEYEILDIVIGIIGNKLVWSKAKKASLMALSQLKEEAIAIGADAVVGIKPDTTVTGSPCYIGTAVKLIKREK